MGNFHSNPCDTDAGCYGDPATVRKDAASMNKPTPAPKPVVMTTQKTAPPTALSPFDTLTQQAQRYGNTPTSY